MSAMIECAFINSVITSDRSYDRDKNPRGDSGNTTPTCAQQDTMEKRISGLRMVWLKPSAARDKSGYGVHSVPSHTSSISHISRNVKCD
jgi:hypothetical protein